MKTTGRVLAVLLLLTALAAGGFYFTTGHLPAWPPPGPPTAPIPAPAEAPAPVELPAPVLTGEPEAPSAPAGAVATLVEMERTVKAKRASDLSWEDAKRQMPLYENDSVRTFEKSAATISFGPDDLLDVDQNALVIIKPRLKDAGGPEISLALLSSDFLDSLASKPAPERDKAIQAASAARQVTIRSMPGGARPGVKTRIAVRTLPDRSTSVAVLTGSAKIVNPRGGEVVLKEKMVTRVTETGLLAPRLLPGNPEPIFPDDGATYGFARRAPGVELKGRTERDARVRVNGQKAAVGPDGSFSFPLTLKEGVNLVTVEAIDAAGNSEYGKRLITYKGSKRATASMSGN